MSTVAEKAGISSTLYFQIENDVISPPISTLMKIARALEVDIQVFFESKEEKKRFVVVKRDERRIIPERYIQGKITEGYSYEALAYKKGRKIMEPFLVTFDIVERDEIITYQHEGEEFLYLLEGELEFTIDGEYTTLSEGDSLYFDASYSHGYRGIGDKKPRALVVVSARE